MRKSCRNSNSSEDHVFCYRAVDKYGETSDFLVTEQRDQKAAIVSYNAQHNTTIIIRKNKCLNNIVEQDHRGVKRVTRPMLGFKSFGAAQSTLTGIELLRMIKKGQMEGDESKICDKAQECRDVRMVPNG